MLKGRSLFGVNVIIEDSNHIITMITYVEWYVQKVIENTTN